MCELNDGSFNLDDRLIPNLERKVEEYKRLAKPPDVIVSALEGDGYIPVQVSFSLNRGGHRDARFMAGDGILISFSDDEPSEWRRAGSVLFGYDGSINLLAIAIMDVNEAQIARIRDWICED